MMVCRVLVLPLSPKGIWQAETKVLLGWRRVSASHRLGRRRRMGWKAGWLPFTSRQAEQISKWHPEVLKGNQGSMPPIDQSMSWGCGGEEQEKIIKAEA